MEIFIYIERVHARRSAYSQCSEEQALVYACEDVVDYELGSPALAGTSLQDFVLSVCHRENIEPPIIRHHRNPSVHASADLDTWTVCVSRRTITTSVIMHELAHFSVGIDSHGVLFRDELIRLLRSNVSLEHAALLHSLFTHVGLEMSPWSASSRRY